MKTAWFSGKIAKNLDLRYFFCQKVCIIQENSLPLHPQSKESTLLQ
jgi:hypothetical protein